MGQSAQAWEKLSTMIAEANFDDVTEIYGNDAIFLEPYNPPHRGNLLIQAYLKDYFYGKTDIAVEVVKLLESADGRTLGVEWNLSYDAAGRRWNNMARASFFELDDDGLIAHHRDYS